MLAAASTEFADPAALTAWTNLRKTEGGADWIQKIDVGSTVPGSLFLETKVCGWFETYRGVLLYQNLTGDVVMHLRLRVQGAHQEDPTRTYSLAGAMLRVPRQDNWNFITVGTGDHPQQVETKTTVNGASDLRLQHGASGWNEIILARIGSYVVTAYRPDGGAWKIMSRWQRVNLPTELQWGIAAYTDWLNFGTRPSSQANQAVVSGTPDLRLSVDFARFYKPASPADAPLDNPLTIPDAQLLQLVIPAT